MSKCYLTRYDEYPIYEPAEGGYYYSGQDVEEYYECDSMEEAKQQLANMKEELEYCGFEVLEEGAYLRSKYIGEGVLWVIENELGENKRGWHPYC